MLGKGIYMTAIIQSIKLLIQACSGVIWRAVAAILKLFGITVCLAKFECQRTRKMTCNHSLVIFLYACAIHYENVALQLVNRASGWYFQFDLHVWEQSSISCLWVLLVDHILHWSENASRQVNLEINLQQQDLTRFHCRCETTKGQSVWWVPQGNKKGRTAIFCLSMYAALLGSQCWRVTCKWV